MSLRSLLRLLAGLTVAMTLFVGWTSPGEAHGAHDASAVSQTYEDVVGAAPASTQQQAVDAGDKSRPSADASEPDCAGHGSSPGNDSKTCCSNTCHAVMSTELGLPLALSMARTASPRATEPSALQGPTIHIKRPPRPLAALVG